MRNFLLIAGAALSVTACASMAPTPRAAMPYMQMAASSDQFEIQSSQVALQKSQSDETKRYAQMLIEHHTQTSATLMAAAQQGGLTPPPPTLVPRHAAMLETIRNAPADRFDRVYITAQVPAHAEALALHQNYAANGDNQALRGAASAAVPFVQQHLDEARRMAGAM
jgi:putative membrane protein